MVTETTEIHILNEDEIREALTDFFKKKLGKRIKIDPKEIQLRTYMVDYETKLDLEARYIIQTKTQ